MADRRTQVPTKPGQERPIFSLPREASHVAGIIVWIVRQIFTPLPLEGLEASFCVGLPPLCFSLVQEEGDPGHCPPRARDKGAEPSQLTADPAWTHDRLTGLPRAPQTCGHAAE